MRKAAIQANVLKENVIIPLGVLDINGLKIKPSAYCPFSHFKTTSDSDICIIYYLAEYKFEEASITASSSCTTSQGFLAGLKSLLDNKAKELTDLEKWQDAMKQKLENLSGEAQKLFPYSEEQSSLKTELEQLLIDLNKNGEFAQKEERHFMPLLSEFFPGIPLREPVREAREILFTPTEPEEPETIPEEECA